MFVIGKLAEMVAAPLNLLMLALVLAVGLERVGRQRAAARIVAACALFLVLVAALPWGEWLVAPLEDRFPPPAHAPARVDGIIILGGGINPVLSDARGETSLGGAAERVVAFVELARRYPAARIVYSGGSGSVMRQDLKEAPLARDLMGRLGGDSSRVIYEEQSRNTWENAVFSYRLAQPQPGQTWLLVTSAWHMPRSMGAFRAAGWSVVPYPVDYSTTGRGGRSVGELPRNLVAINMALHEWLGLAYYRVRGWSGRLFPSP